MSVTLDSSSQKKPAVHYPDSDGKPLAEIAQLKAELERLKGKQSNP